MVVPMDRGARHSIMSTTPAAVSLTPTSSEDCLVKSTSNIYLFKTHENKNNSFFLLVKRYISFVFIAES